MTIYNTLAMPIKLAVQSDKFIVKSTLNMVYKGHREIERKPVPGQWQLFGI